MEIVASDDLSAVRDGITVRFHGVRGSTPCHSPDLVRYGGNTSCVSVAVEGHEPILLDLGTGLRYFGNRFGPGRPFRGTCLVSHLHWDHIQGLPFFVPLLQSGSDVSIYGPRQQGSRTLADEFGDAICPPLFPVTLETLPGSVEFYDVERDSFSIGEIGVMSRPVPHVGPTVGYRITYNGSSLAYLSDHQMPIDGSFAATDEALELCDGVDLLIHDAQYTPPEFAQKRDWGHCTVDYAVWLAGQAGCKRLALFHHDPSHDDDMIDALATMAAACGREKGVEVFAAAEGMAIDLVAD